MRKIINNIRDFGNLIAAIRSERKLNQDAFGRAIGASRGLISKIENGIGSVASDRLFDICGQLGISLSASKAVTPRKPEEESDNAEIDILNDIHFPNSFTYYTHDRKSKQAQSRLLKNLVGSRRVIFQKEARAVMGNHSIAAWLFVFEKINGFNLIPSLGLEQVAYSHLAILSVENLLAIQGAHGSLHGYATKVKPETLFNPIDGQTTTTRKTSSRRVVLSKTAIQKRQLQADNLNISLSVAAAFQSTLDSCQIIDKDADYRIDCKKSKVTVPMQQRSLAGHARWIINAYTSGGNNKESFFGFLNSKSNEIDLKTLTPKRVALDIKGIASETDNPYTIIRAENSQPATAQEARELLEESDGQITVDIRGKYAVAKLGENKIIEFRKRKSRLAIRSKWLDSYLVDYGEGDSRSLRKVVEDRQAFYMDFANSTLVYSYGEIYDAAEIADLKPTIMQAFRTYNELSKATSEKGEPFLPAQTSFKSDSLFGLVENVIAKDAKHLFCDDLGDEWADHVGIRTNGDRAIEFFVSKHLDGNATASRLHDAISQSLKNILNILSGREKIKTKINSKWNADYVSGHVKTGISRNRKASLCSEALDDFTEAWINPGIEKRLYLVANNIRRSMISQTLDRVKAKSAVEPHELQLVCLLSMFVMCCMDYDIRPVICSVD